MKWEYTWLKVWLATKESTSDAKRREKARLDASVQEGDWVAFDLELKRYVNLGDALNKLGEQGWELITTHAETVGGELSWPQSHVYVLKRPRSRDA